MSGNAQMNKGKQRKEAGTAVRVPAFFGVFFQKALLVKNFYLVVDKE